MADTVSVVDSLGRVVQAPRDDAKIADGSLRLATQEEVLQDKAAKADQAAYSANPESYVAGAIADAAAQAESIRMAKDKAADEAMGGPISRALLGTGTAYLLGPAGLTVGAFGAGQAVLRGAPITPETLTRANLGAIGYIPGVEAAAGGMFGRDTVNAVMGGTGYAGGQMAGALGAAFGGPAAMIGKGAGLGTVAVAEGVENFVLNSAQSMTDDYLAGNPVNASKALASGGLGAFIGAGIPLVAAGTSKALGAAAKRIGRSSEASLGVADDWVRIRKNYIEKGIDFDGMHRAAGSPDLATIEGTQRMARNLEKDLGAIGREAADIRARIAAKDVPVAPVRSADILEDVSMNMKEILPTWGSFVAKGETFTSAAKKAGQLEVARAQAIANPVRIPGQKAPPFGSKAVLREAIVNSQTGVGAARVLDKVEQMGGITAGNLKELKKFAETMSPIQRQGAKRTIAHFETRLNQFVAEAEPKLGARLKELDARKRMTELTLIDVEKIASKKPGGGGPIISPFNWGMAAVGALHGWHASLGYLAGKVGIEGVRKAARKLIPSVAAGNRAAAMIDATSLAISKAAKAAARTAATNREPRKPKPIQADPLKLAKDIREIQPLVKDVQLPNSLGMASPQLGNQVNTKAAMVAKNIDAKIQELAPVAHAQALRESSTSELQGPFGPIGALIAGPKSATKKRDMGVGELTAYMYAQAAMNPMETIEAIQDMNFNNIQIEAMRDNWPELMDELANEMVVTIMDEGLSGDVSLENRARIAKIVGMPIDLSTSPDFFQQIQSVFVQPEDQQAPSPGPGNQRIPTNFATETEKLEEQ